MMALFNESYHDLTWYVLVPKDQQQRRFTVLVENVISCIVVADYPIHANIWDGGISMATKWYKVKDISSKYDLLFDFL